MGQPRFLQVDSVQARRGFGPRQGQGYLQRGDFIDLSDYERRLSQIKDIFSAIEHPHVWPFQLLLAVQQSHEKGVCHGDIKCQNVLITSSNWLYLADFASFKPTYIPYDDPSDFSFFFDTGGRRLCYLAPEPSMDVFPADKNSCGKICSLIKEFASRRFDMKEEVILTVLTRLELGDVQYLHLLPQINATCVLNFHKTPPPFLAQKISAIAVILKRSESKQGQCVFDIPIVANDMGVTAVELTNQLYNLKVWMSG